MREAENILRQGEITYEIGSLILSRVSVVGV